jgi:hypothetical protein
MSIGGQQEALRRERDKLAEDYKKLSVKHANVLKERDELVTIREDMLARARKAEAERDASNQEARRLLLIITNHRDQRGDDRCWLDDQDMYTAVGLSPANTALPPAEEFAANCKRFHESRQRPGDKYETVAEMVAKERWAWRTQTLEEAIVEMKVYGGRFEFDGHAETAEEILRKLMEKKR